MTLAQVRMFLAAAARAEQRRIGQTAYAVALAIGSAFGDSDAARAISELSNT